MSSIRVLSIFGTRPEAVKMAPVIRELASISGIDSKVCVTAQHREMLDQILALFDIHPDIDLNLMQPDQSLSALTANIFTHLDPILGDLNPDWVLVQGDTTTVMAASLLSYYHRIKVGHVEAGLRTKNKYHPFPEEINRRVAGVVADLHFAPTEWSRRNLLREGASEESIIVTGNPVIDALQIVSQMPYHPEDGPLSNLPENQRIILVTAHRRENFGEPIEEICRALLNIASAYQGDVHIVYPVHLNPKVQEPVYRLLGDVPNITLLPPLDYLPMVHLLKRATLVLTDSGGIQEEAPGLGKPVLVLRKVTERPEGVEAGVIRLVGPYYQTIVSETCLLLDDSDAYASMSQAVNPYGDGNAAKKIVAGLLQHSKK